MKPGAIISLDKIDTPTAVRYTQKWRTNNPNSIKAFLTNINEIQQILNQFSADGGPAITQIRMYFGINDSNDETLVLVGVDDNGHDIVEYTLPNGDVESGTYDFMLPCPHTCDKNSVLFK